MLLSAHGADAIAVTVVPAGAAAPPAGYPSALLAAPAHSDTGGSAPPTSLTNGNLRARLDGGLLVFERVSDGADSRGR